MVTHAGLGSVASALSRGVPLVCAPISRDQPLNAAQVTRLGAGVDVGVDPSPGEVADAILEVLSQPRYRDAAQSLSQASAAAGGSEAAVTAIEEILS
jgi:UDP:flavonoid glycosyltransferase YjiC (YdhE family)